MPKTKRILVIEDEDDVRDVIHTILTGAGYEVEAQPYLASSIEEGLSGNYDLITLDLNMPAIDGSDVAKVFEHRNLKTPVLVVSGYLNKSLIEHLRELGVRHFLPKPFRAEGLIEAVKEILL